MLPLNESWRFVMMLQKKKKINYFIVKHDTESELQTQIEFN